MKYSVLLVLFYSAFANAQNKLCEPKLDTLTKILVYSNVTEAKHDGGLQSLYKLIGEKLIFPRQFRDDDCPKIMFAFIVNEFGKAVGLRMLTKKYDTIETQLTRILEDTRWEPGKCNGKKVPSFIIFHIAIKCG